MEPSVYMHPTSNTIFSTTSNTIFSERLNNLQHELTTFKNVYGIDVEQLNNDKKARKTFLNQTVDYNDGRKLAIALTFFKVNVKKIPDDLLHQFSIMILLVKQNPDNILLLKRNIASFKHVAIEAVSKEGLLLKDIFHIVQECPMEDQREIIMAAVANDGWVLKFPLSGTEWLTDMEIVYLGVKHKYLTNYGCGRYGFKHPLEKESDQLLNDYDLMKTALEYDEGTFNIFNRDMVNRKDLLEYALSEDDTHIYSVDSDDSLNEEFVLYLIEKEFWGPLYRLFHIFKKEIREISDQPDQCDLVDLLRQHLPHSKTQKFEGILT